MEGPGPGGGLRSGPHPARRVHGGLPAREENASAPRLRPWLKRRLPGLLRGLGCTDAGPVLRPPPGPGLHRRRTRGARGLRPMPRGSARKSPAARHGPRQGKPAACCAKVTPRSVGARGMERRPPRHRPSTRPALHGRQLVEAAPCVICAPLERPPMIFRFGAYEIDPGRYELRRDGGPAVRRPARPRPRAAPSTRASAPRPPRSGSRFVLRVS